MKDKLVKLIEKGHREYFNRCSGMDKPFIVFIADYLFANDVVVREKGEWDDSGRYQFMDGTKAIRCTECGCALTEIEYQKYFYNFCPVCGADMRGE